MPPEDARRVTCLLHHNSLESRRRRAVEKTESPSPPHLNMAQHTATRMSVAGVHAGALHAGRKACRIEVEGAFPTTVSATVSERTRTHTSVGQRAHLLHDPPSELDGIIDGMSPSLCSAATG